MGQSYSQPTQPTESSLNQNISDNKNKINTDINPSIKSANSRINTDEWIDFVNNIANQTDINLINKEPILLQNYMNIQFQINNYNNLIPSIIQQRQQFISDTIAAYNTAYILLYLTNPAQAEQYIQSLQNIQQNL